MEFKAKLLTGHIQGAFMTRLTMQRPVRVEGEFLEVDCLIKSEAVRLIGSYCQGKPEALAALVASILEVPVSKVKAAIELDQFWSKARN